MEIAILGLGFVGTRLADQLNYAGHTVYGVRRSEIQGASYLTFRADITRLEELSALPQSVTHIVFAAAPGATGAKRGESATSNSATDLYKSLYVGGCQALVQWSKQLPQLQRVLFVSSTSVYADAQGGWVTEQTIAQASTWNGQCLLEAERELSALACPHISLRCAGIYGPGRTRLLDSVRSGSASFDPSAPQYMNRIHRDDVAGAVQHLLSLEGPEALYIGVDDEPASDATVLPWLAARLGAPAIVPRPATEASARGAAANKRCSNAKLRATGYQFAFPSFREGYAAMLK